MKATVKATVRAMIAAAILAAWVAAATFAVLGGCVNRPAGVGTDEWVTVRTLDGGTVECLSHNNGELLCDWESYNAGVAR